MLIHGGAGANKKDAGIIINPAHVRRQITLTMPPILLIRHAIGMLHLPPDGAWKQTATHSTGIKAPALQQALIMDWLVQCVQNAMARQRNNAGHIPRQGQQRVLQ